MFLKQQRSKEKGEFWPALSEKNDLFISRKELKVLL